MNFKQFIQLNEGGYANYVDENGKVIQAEKIDLIKTGGRQEFMDKFVEAFKVINKLFSKKYKQKLWIDEKKLVTGELFNGSTSYIFDASIPESELLKYKKVAGDLDIIVPEELKLEVAEFLTSIEGEKITKDVILMAVANKLDFGDTVIAIFKAKFGDYIVKAQVDFECLPVDRKTGTPDQWAKFSRSSSFKDASNGIKAVFHKWLIASLIGAISTRDNMVVVTNSSTPEKYKLKKLKSLPKMLKFSVSKGARVAYELQKLPDGTAWEIDDKDVYKEIPTKDSTFVTSVSGIYKLAFGKLEDNPRDVEKMWNFVGVVDLINKYADSKTIKATKDRFVDFLWSPFSQMVEGDKNEDLKVKNGAFSYVIKNLQGVDATKGDFAKAESYYKDKK